FYSHSVSHDRGALLPIPWERERGKCVRREHSWTVRHVCDTNMTGSSVTNGLLKCSP
uniref:Uncharacterized protein n=1 Tax=Mola mola TaxID=94237 RepID=A0A3Q3WEK1_MOLML